MKRLKLALFFLMVVAKDNTKASEMGWDIEAFANGNLVLFVPLNYFPYLLIGQSAGYRSQLVSAQCRHGAVQ